MVHSKRQLNRYEAMVAWVFILPTLLGLLIFRILPIFVTIGLSFTNWKMMGSFRWIGLLNYRELTLFDPIFTLSMKNTVIFLLVSIPGSLSFALLVAMKLNEDIPAKQFRQYISFLTSQRLLPLPVYSYGFSTLKESCLAFSFMLQRGILQTFF